MTPPDRDGSTVDEVPAVLVYEAIVASGQADDPLMAAGRSMLETTIAAFGRRPVVTVVASDAVGRELQATFPNLATHDCFRDAVAACSASATDTAAILIAPDVDLPDLIEAVDSEGIERVRNLSTAATRLCSDKVALSRWLADRGIPCVAHEPFVFDGPPVRDRPVWVKPRFGCGCIETSRLPSLSHWTPSASEGRSPVEMCFAEEIPHRESVSTLVVPRGDGQIEVWPLCEQSITIEADGTAAFAGVRFLGERCPKVGAIARRLADGWKAAGPFGIDLLRTDDGPVVVEVNPRLTESLAVYAKAADRPLGGKLLGTNCDPILWSGPD